MYAAGLIGHDPLTVVIGESDPYVNIGGRVCILPHVGAILCNILPSCSLSHYLIIRLSSGDKSSSCRFCLDDNNNDTCFPDFNSYCPAHTGSYICPEGMYCAKFIGFTCGPFH